MTVKLALETIHSDEEFVAELRREFPDVEFRPSADKEEERANIRDADVFWGSPSRELVLAAERLRWVQCVGTGVEGIVSVREIVDSDVVLTNCRGPHADPLADHVMGMVIVLAHKLNEMWDDQRERRWEPSKYDNRQLDLNGSTMGILALGDIGTAVARRAHGFGIRDLRGGQASASGSAHRRGGLGPGEARRTAGDLRLVRRRSPAHQ